MLSAPDLRKDTTLLYFLVEPSEETLEALPVIKHYFSHMIHPLSATKGTQIFMTILATQEQCVKGKERPFGAGIQMAPSPGSPMISASPLA